MKHFSFIIFLASISFVQGQLVFTPVDTLPMGAYGAAAWGDFDNDNQQDLAYITQSAPTEIFKVYRNVSNSFIEVAQQFPVLFNPAVKWADFNNDGFDDLIACGMGGDSVLSDMVVLYQSNGNGTFAEISHSFPGLSSGSIAIGDYNNDGKKDFAYTGNDSAGFHHAFIYRNNGNFNFTDINSSLMGIHFGEMQFGDYNNDNLADLIINGIGDADFRCRVYKNMGNDSFQLQPFYIKGSGGTVDWFDYNKDGALDILITGYDSTSTNSFTELHQNNQNGTFSLVASNLPVFGEPSAVAIADFNNDSSPDVCLAGGNNSFVNSSMALGNGTLSFSVTDFFQVDILNTVAEESDIDNDGDVDLLLNNVVLRNDMPLGIADGTEQADLLSIFPVPAEGSLTIRLQKAGEVSKVTVYSYDGRVVWQCNTSLEVLHLNLEELAAGIYSVRVETSDALQTKRFIKK